MISYEADSERISTDNILKINALIDSFILRQFKVFIHWCDINYAL